MSGISFILCRTCYNLIDGTIRDTLLAQRKIYGNGATPQILDALNLHRVCCRTNITSSPCLPQGIIVENFNDPVIEQQFRFAGLETQYTPLALALFKQQTAAFNASPKAKEFEDSERTEVRKLLLSLLDPRLSTEQKKEAEDSHLAWLRNRLLGNFNLALIPATEVGTHFHLYRRLINLRTEAVIFEICQQLKVRGGSRRVPIPIVAIGDTGMLQHTYLQIYDQTFDRADTTTPTVALNALPIVSSMGEKLTSNEIDALFA